MSRVGINSANFVHLTLSCQPLHLLLFVLIATNLVDASEFPERECCDPIYPIPEPTSKVPSVPAPTGKSESLQIYEDDLENADNEEIRQYKFCISEYNGYIKDRTINIDKILSDVRKHFPQVLPHELIAGRALLKSCKNAGSDIKIAQAILNCLFARQLCFEDPSCSAILEIIPRVCGPELVACSTVTVTKCQVALKTLQAFSFFRPTCLCKEPHVDPECNSFQNFLFDHPCIYVMKKDKNPYPEDALMTCSHALTVCQRAVPCFKLFEDFKNSCKIRDGKCKMESREACYETWSQIRLSLMFGCICPGNQNKKRCDRIFLTVNRNPCVDFLPSSASLDLSGTDSALYPFDPQQENFQEIWLPPTSMYPYFLFPPTARTYNYDLDDNDRHRHGHYGLPEVPGSPGIGKHKVDVYHEYDQYPYVGVDHSGPGGSNEERRNLEIDHEDFSSSSSSSASSSLFNLPKHEKAPEHLQPIEHDLDRHESNLGNQHYHHYFNLHRHRDWHHHINHSAAPRPAPQPAPPVIEKENDPAQPAPPLQPGTNVFAPRPTYEHGAVVVDRIDDAFGLPVDQLFDLSEAFEGFVAQVRIVAHPDNTTSFEIIESQLENPLIDADHEDLHALKQLALPGFRHQPHYQRNHTLDDHDDSSGDIENVIHQPVKLILSSTCHQAYSMCRNDSTCKALLQPVLNHCDASRCARNECMNALQHFYKKANDSHSMEIAFCLCRKTSDRSDECIIAQEKMHPECAQGIQSNDRNDLPTCHSLAQSCRENSICRSKLEHYEQSCAVDSLTKKCAGPPADCRRAMLGILGTELRSNCACKGTELTQMSDCLGWQRLLWVNSCVVDSQKDFHARKKHHHHLHPRTTTSTEALSTTPTFLATTPTITERAEDDNVIPEVTRKETTQPTITSETSISTTITSTTSMTTMEQVTTPSTTTTSTTPPRFCVFQRPSQSHHQYIREGKGKRLYHDNEPECSDLCQCGEGVTLVCNTICVKSSPCKTDFAFYNHAAPAYQAYRGRCLCYSGRFICMRPSPETYNIPHGVFMFLGYSETDENLLKPHNNLTVLDAVNSLDSFMREQANNQTVCTLFLYNVTRENVIAVARLGGDNPPPNSTQAQSLQHLLRIKEECGGMLQDLSDKINNKHQEVHTHPLLSIFKMAEVEVKLPPGSKATKTTNPSSFILFIISITIFMQWSYSSSLNLVINDNLTS